MKVEEKIWIFSGIDSRFPAGAFLKFEIAVDWIKEYKLTGVLTEYPLNKGVYNWAIEKKYFKITKDKHKTSRFIGMFSSAHQKHVHFENGNRTS